MQRKYLKKLTSMINCDAVQTLMDAGLKLSKSQEEGNMDEKNYRRIFGCLRYLLHTRLDLSYSVGVLSMYMHKPTESHYAALRFYDKGTFGYRFMFKRSNKSELIGYSDNSHNVDIDDG